MTKALLKKCYSFHCCSQTTLLVDPLNNYRGETEPFQPNLSRNTKNKCLSPSFFFFVANMFNRDQEEGWKKQQVFHEPLICHLEHCCMLSDKYKKQRLISGFHLFWLCLLSRRAGCFSFCLMITHNVAPSSAAFSFSFYTEFLKRELFQLPFRLHQSFFSSLFYAFSQMHWCNTCRKPLCSYSWF